MFGRKIKLNSLKSVRLYRDILKIIKTLDPAYHKMYYDYTRLKFAENTRIRSEKDLDRLVSAAREEIDWVKSVVARKSDNNK